MSSLLYMPSPLPWRQCQVRLTLDPLALSTFPIIMAGRLPQGIFGDCSVFVARYGCTVTAPLKKPFLHILQPIHCLLNCSKVLPARAKVAGRDAYPLNSYALSGAYTTTPPSVRSCPSSSVDRPGCSTTRPKVRPPVLNFTALLRLPKPTAKPDVWLRHALERFAQATSV